MITILAEIPEPLHEALQIYLEQHPNWDCDRALTAALSLFLLQHQCSDASQFDPHASQLVDAPCEEDYEVCPSCFNAEADIADYCSICGGTGYL